MVIKKPWLLLPPSIGHSLYPFAIEVLSRFYKPLTWQAFTWKNLHFPSPLGIAGGVDKNAEQVLAWQNLGSGFCEVGTITPRPQASLPAPNVGRSVKHLALWNHLGFPSKGMDHIAASLSKKRPHLHQPLFINIGKQRETPLDQALKDYLSLINKFQNLADVFVLNISSPNTKNLRNLLASTQLDNFLKNIRQACKNPLILKLSPDMEEKQFLEVIDTSLKNQLDGWCLSNSTQQRDNSSTFPKHGGVSGKPLANTSLLLLRKLKQHLGASHPDKLIISCGGILTPSDVLQRLHEGAHLVQVYSALVFHGPHFFKSVYKFQSSTSV